jgi:uncharacterized protein YegJ (DUF2314 family)
MSESANSQATVILGIPGPWHDARELFAAIGKETGKGKPDYLALPPVLSHVSSGFSCIVEVQPFNPELAKVFQTLGQGRFHPDDLQLITEHKSTAYLVAAKPDLADARELMRTAAFLLRLGGTGVLVESSGVAQPKDRWLYYADSATVLSTYDAFVVLVGTKDFSYSCGMHTFGLPDASVTSEFPIEEAPQILNAFNQWCLLENPVDPCCRLFTTGIDEPRFSVALKPYGYDLDDYKNNPFGRYHLELTQQKLPTDSKFHQRDEPLFAAVRKEDTAKWTAQARETLPFFLNYVRSKYEYGTYMFKTKVNEDGNEAYLWLALSTADEDWLEGVIFEIPHDFGKLKVNTRLKVGLNEIFDWCIIRNATLIGGYSMRSQRELNDVDRRYLADLYQGTLSFAPLEELVQPNN